MLSNIILLDLICSEIVGRFYLIALNVQKNSSCFSEASMALEGLILLRTDTLGWNHEVRFKTFKPITMTQWAKWHL